MADLTIPETFDLALRHHQAGRLHDAEQLYRQILVRQPENLGALRNLALIAHQSGRNEMAVDLIRRAIGVTPNDAEVHSDLGIVLKDTGQLDEAIAAYRQAIVLKPNYAEAHNNLGNALICKGQLDEAIDAYRQAIALRPGFAGAHNNLGVALSDKGQLEESIAAYRRAVILKPDYSEAHKNLGNALKEKGQLDEAIAAYRQAIALNPNFPEAHFNLGNALADKEGLDEAIAAYRHAVALNPNLAEAHNNLGNALKYKGQLDESIAAYRQAIAVRPGYAEAHSNLLQTLHYHPAYNADAIAEEYRRWNHRHAETLKRFIEPHTNDRDPDRRLRIGYVSADFFAHPSAHFLLPLFRHHDQRRFEVFCYAQEAHSDEVTRQMQDQVQHWRKTDGLSDTQVAGRVRQDQIDILVDLKLHTADNRLLIFARKPAPVQVSWLGYPGTTGMDTIDYRLTDPYLDPPGLDDAYHRGRSIHLPETFWCYDPLTINPAVNASPCLEAGFVTFGCLNNFCKVNEEVVQLWTRVLKRVERSRLMLLCPEGSHRQSLLDLLKREGIDPDRVELVARRPRRQYLELYHRIDVGLDTFPYNGHTTSLDSFWMGVPVITLVGQTAVGRAGLSQLTNLGLTELIAKTPEQYVEVATGLAADLPRLADLRRTLRARIQASPLMDAPRFVRNIEAAYRQMWQAWCEAVCAKS